MADDREMGTRLNDGEGLEIAHEEDFGIQRGEDGDLLPVTQRIPGTEKAIKVRPPAQITEYEDVFEQTTASDSRVAEVLDRFVVEGIGQGADEQWVTETPDYLVAGILQAIKNAGGHEVFLATQQQQTEENLGFLDMMDLDAIEDEDLERLMKFGENTPSPSSSSSQS